MIINREELLCGEYVSWQNRSISSVYLIIWLDRLGLIKDSNKTIFIISGINEDGLKEVLGLWMGEENNDSFWLNVLTDIKSRGCRDILIVCSENIYGFEDNMRAVFLDRPIQMRMINLMKRTMRYIVPEDRFEYSEDMRRIYAASTWRKGDIAYKEFSRKWRDKYPYTIKRFDQKPYEFITFFSFPKTIRQIVYTTNIKDSIELKIKYYIKNILLEKKDEVILQTVYSIIEEDIRRWNNPIRNWEPVLKQFLAIFEFRIQSYS